MSRTDFLASPQFGFNPDPAANLQTNNDKKTVKNNKMSQSISSELKTVSHPWLCDHEGRKGRNRMLQEGEVSWSWAECLYRRTITRAQLCLLDPYMGLPLTRHSPPGKGDEGGDAIYNTILKIIMFQHKMPSIIQSSKSPPQEEGGAPSPVHFLPGQLIHICGWTSSPFVEPSRQNWAQACAS